MVEKKETATSQEKNKVEPATKHLDPKEGCAKPFVAESHRLEEDDDSCEDGVH